METARYPIFEEIERPDAEDITAEADPGGFVKFQYFEDVKIKKQEIGAYGIKQASAVWNNSSSTFPRIERENQAGCDLGRREQKTRSA
jgi:hypothetical protein